MNEQVFKLRVVDKESADLRVYAEYKLLDKVSHHYISYDEIVSYLETVMPKKVYRALSGDVLQDHYVDYELVENLSHKALEVAMHKILWDKLRVDLIIENRKLKSTIMRMVGSTTTAMGYFENIEKEAGKHINSYNPISKIGKRYHRAVAEVTLSKVAVDFLKDIWSWAKV